MHLVLELSLAKAGSKNQDFMFRFEHFRSANVSS